jgi:hypothetical protein
MSSIGFCWYFHLPSVASESEVHEHAVESLALLLSLHRDSNRPLLLAPTGSFLELCRRHEPAVLESVAEALSTGIAQLGLTYFHETDPFEVRHVVAGELLRRDAELKQRMFGTTPTWFVPANYLWVPGTERHCATLGVTQLILDSRHFAEATALRAWRWDTSGRTGEVRPRPVDTVLDENETLAAHVVRFGAGAQMTAVWRDWPATRDLTFGSGGVIHQYDLDVVDHVVDRIAERPGLVVIADDGDRVRGDSRAAYERVLQLSDDVFDWNITQLPRREMVGLSAFAPAGVAEMLHGHEDARAYWHLLRQIETSALTPTQYDVYLAAHDVFYPFWPDTARRLDYLNQVLDMVETTSGSDRLGSGGQ